MNELIDVNDLIGFLNAQIGEDEQKARAASDGPWRYDERKFHHLPGTSLRSEAVFSGPAGHDALCVATTGDYDDPQSMRDADHIARHDPARVLREVKAKRRIIALAEQAEDAANKVGDDYMMAEDYMASTLKLLALPYADHPDYQEAWRV